MLRALDGDARAYGELLEALGGYLRAYFVRRLGSGAADIEDLVQETLLAIHLKRETYDRALPFTPWAYAVARYKMLDQFRRMRTRPTTPIDDVADLFLVEAAEEPCVRDDLDRLLSNLPPRQRAVMKDVKIQGLSMDEAGAKNGMSGMAVRLSVHRGLKALRQRVLDEDR